jgi:hypothetical protein
VIAATAPGSLEVLIEQIVRALRKQLGDLGGAV